MIDDVANTAALTNTAVVSGFNEMRQQLGAIRHEMTQEKDQAIVHSFLKPSTISQDWYDRISKKRLIGTGD